MSIDSDYVIELYRKILNGEEKKFPAGFWEGNQGRLRGAICAKYMLEEVLKFSEEDIRSKYCREIFEEHHLNGMLKKVYSYSTSRVLDDIYPRRYLMWEIGSVPKGYWSGKRERIMAFVWLLQECNIKFEDVGKTKIKAKEFKTRNLLGLLRCYNNNVTKLVEDLCPIMPEHLK